MQLMKRFLIKRQIIWAGMLVMLTGSLWGVARGDSPPDQTLPTSLGRLHGEQVSASDTLRQRAGYLAQETPFLGTIIQSLSGEPRLSSTGDDVVIDAGLEHHLQVGDLLTIFRGLPPASYTDKTTDKRVSILGNATVVRAQEATAVIRIYQAFGEIASGDRVQRFGVLPPVVASPDTAPAPPPSGSIVASKDDRLAIAAGDIVYLNQGAVHGVRKGDRFVVLDPQQTVRHPDSQRLVPLPPQAIGTLTIINVQAHTATALVASSKRELSVGAHVVYTDTASTDHKPTGRVVVAALSDHNPEQLWRLQAAKLEAQVSPCLEEVRRAVRAAEAAGASPQELAVVKNTLEYAAVTWQRAQELLAQGKHEEAARLLEMARSDCLTAQQMAQQTSWHVTNGGGLPAENYTVQPGDTLWSIAAHTTIYHDPWWWPLLYSANRDRINDPDLIFPQQVLAVPRGVSQGEAAAAAQHARTRGPWRIDDGPDTYVLDGMRR